MKKNNFFSLNLPDKIFGIEIAFIKLLLIPVPLILVFLISLKLVIIPKITEIGEINNKIKSTGSQTSLVKTKNNYLKSIDQVDLKDKAQFLNSAVLSENKAYVLTEIIRKIADKYSFYITSFTITPGEIKNGDTDSNIQMGSEKDAIKKTPVKLTLSGPNDKMLDLIIALEKSLPILFIDSFETKTKDSLTELDLTVSSYYMNNNVSFNTKDLTLTDLTLTDEESGLLKKLSEFNKIDLSSSDSTDSATFKEYSRENPFNL